MPCLRLTGFKTRPLNAGLYLILLLSLGLPDRGVIYASDIGGRGSGGLESPQETPGIYFPIVFKNYSAEQGSIYGYVVDSENGLGVAGAQVCYLTNCITSGPQGYYELYDLPPGVLSFHVSATEYVDLDETMTVAAGQGVYHQFVITRQLIYLTNVFIRIVLTWRPELQFQTPSGPIDNDMDVHMWLVIPDIPLWHIYYNNKGDCTTLPNLCMKTDKTQGAGPETMDISELEPEGVYYFGVHNVNSHYPNWPPMNQMSAIVRIYDNSETGLKAAFMDPPSGEGNFWYVFRMDDQGGVTTVNCLTNYDPSVVPTCL
jgi:hypothetical protein